MSNRQRNSDAVSFNDDTSPDSRLTTGRRVSVNAQVVAEDSVDWYYRILHRCAPVPAELKSTRVWVIFQSLPPEEREKIWSGLSKVRIHVVDPRPYSQHWDDVVNAAWRRDDATRLIRQFALEGMPSAKAFLDQLEILTAQSVLADSFAARVQRIGRYLRDELMFFARDEDRSEESVVDLQDFSQDAKPIVRKVSNWSAKSAATFHEPMDCFLSPDEDILNLRYFPNDLMRKRMMSRVLQAHAFDKGDRQQLELLESARKNILLTLRPFDSLTELDEAAPYSEVDSSESYLIQAADSAAGIAARILETENLVALVSHFSYVSYNGRRISVADAEEELRQQRSRRKVL
jgi:hypothetical protein